MQRARTQVLSSHSVRFALTLRVTPELARSRLVRRSDWQSRATTFGDGRATQRRYFRGLDPSDQQERQNRCRSQQSFERIAQNRAYEANPQSAASAAPTDLK